MRRTFCLGIIAATLFLQGCDVHINANFDGGEFVVGSGNEVSEERKASPFEQVQIEGSVNGTVKKGPFKVVVIGDDNIVPLITTVTKGDVLMIGSTGNYSTKSGLRVEITCPTLTGAMTSGSGNLQVDEIKTDKFSASISGSGNISAAGSAKSAEAKVSGSGNIDFTTLKAESAKARVSGSGNIRFGSLKNLDAVSSGSGNITYRDAQSVEKKESGSGSVRKR